MGGDRGGRRHRICYIISYTAITQTAVWTFELILVTCDYRNVTPGTWHKNTKQVVLTF